MSKERRIDYEKAKHIKLLAIFFIVLIWSFIGKYDYFAWFVLTSVVAVYVSVAIFTYNKFRFTTFTYVMILIHVVILLIGAKYTYSINPSFEYIRDLFNLSRNHFDRIGHFAQGFIPFFIIKEFLLRNGYMKRSKFFYFIVFSLVLAFSAFYELLEFVVVLNLDNYKDAIISPQGDMWDTQWDMILAVTGAISAHLSLGRFHDKKMKEMNKFKA